MQSPIINPQSTICNPQSSIRHNPTECGQMRRKSVRARVPFVHARTRAHEELAQKRGHGAPRAPSHVIPAQAGIYPQATPFPLQNTPFPPPFAIPAPSHVIPAKAGIQHSPIDNQQSAINNSPPPTSFPRRRESGALRPMRIHWRSVGVDRAEPRAAKNLTRFPPSRE